MKRLFFSAMVAVALVSGAACSTTTTEGETTVNAETTTTTTDTAQVAGAAADSASTEQFAYICPMKCEGSASHQPGKCPVCGMDLVENPDFRPDKETLK